MKKDFWNELGDLYLKANALDSAIDSYQKAIQQGYQNSVVYINLANAYMRQGHIVESIQVYQKSIDFIAPIGEKALIYTKIGDCYRRLQDFDNAILAFRMAIDLEPGNPQLIEGLVQVQRDLEKLYSLEEFDILPAGVELFSSDNSTTTDSSHAVAEAEAQVVLNAGLEKDPQVNLPAAEQIPDPVLEPTGLPGLSHECAEIMPPVFAIEFSEQIKESPEDSAYVENGAEMSHPDELLSHNSVLAPQALATGLPELAQSENGIDSSPAFSGIETHQATGNIPEEESVKVTMFLKLGIMYWRNEKLEEASQVLQTAIEGAAKIKNSWVEALAWNALALVKTATADIIGAIRAYLRAAELAPEQIFPWNNVGTLYSNLGNNEEALNSFHRAISQNPEYSASWDGLGDIFTRLGRFEDAIAAYQLGNIFDQRVKGNDVIQSYEKAFAFYHFTLESFPVLDPQDLPTGLAGLSHETEIPQNPGEEYIEKEQSLQAAENFQPEKADLGLKDFLPVSILAEEQADHFAKESEPVLSELEGPASLAVGVDELLPRAGTGIVPQDIPGILVDVPAVIEQKPVLQAIDEYSPIPALQEQDRRSVPVVALYEQFVEGANSIDPVLSDQQDEEEVLFSTNLAGVVGGMFAGEIPSLAGTHGDSVIIPLSEPVEASLEAQQIEEPLPAASDDALLEAVHAPETGVKFPTRAGTGIIPEESGSNPEVGMLPIVSVNPAPRPEVNRVAVTIATYESTVRENPYNDRAWDSLGNLYRIVQRNKDAIRAFERAVALEPTKYVYHYQLGTLYASEGNFAKAIREIQTVVDLNPDFTFAHCALASYLRRVGQDDEAQRHIVIAEPFMKSEKEYDRACFESIRGNVNAALELLEIALEKKQTTVEWIQRDLDLDFIRQDPRYRVLTNKSSQSVLGYQSQSSTGIVP